MIVLTVQTAGAVYEINTAAASLDDLVAPMAAWNKYKRARVQAIFDAGGPGWPPTKKQQGAQQGPQTKDEAAAGDVALRQVADEMLRRKLRRELNRATRKYARGRGNSEAMQRRYAVLQEFERLAAGGEPGASPFVGGRLEKSVSGLRERHARATQKAQGKPLGRVPSSIKSKVMKVDVTIRSEIEWSDAHNKGAVVGHGAKLPQRQFLDIDDQDVKVLVMLIEEHVRSRMGA